MAVAEGVRRAAQAVLDDDAQVIRSTAALAAVGLLIGDIQTGVDIDVLKRHSCLS